jgi:hypothetical protein
MEQHELDITIGLDGKVSVHVKGAKGPACMEYVKMLSQILNSEGEVTNTSEFYEPPTGVAIHLKDTEE